mgnify:CR=1 FL=1
MVHNFLYGSLSWGILWMALLLGSCKDSVEEPGFDDAYARVSHSPHRQGMCPIVKR